MLQELLWKTLLDDSAAVGKAAATKLFPQVVRFAATRDFVQPCSNSIRCHGQQQWESCGHT